MPQRPLPCSSRRQRGASALIVTMLLLFTSSIVVFYLNRGLIFEQKISANQLRSTTAFELAEAGLEWATGMLNNPQDITTNCALLATTNISFRTKYIQTSGTTNVASTTTTFPGCKLNGTGLTCSCPNIAGGGAETVASLGAAALPGFTIAFADVGDPQAVRVTATGCTAQAGACKPLTTTAATTGNSDAWAQVSAILKLRPLLRAAPSAALTCGASCAVGGAYTIRNTEVASNGYVVNAGTTITSSPYAASHYETIPGQPIQNALIAQDTSLSAIASTDPTCTNSAMFRTYFGVPMAEYAASPQVRTISCNNSANCRSQLDTEVAAGWKSFYFPPATGLQLSGNMTFGAPGAGNGINLVTAGDIDITGTVTVYGLLFSNSANVNDVGTGAATIYGAMITCAAYNNNGSGVLSYDANALGGNGLRAGTMARVPGSWRDFTP